MTPRRIPPESFGDLDSFGYYVSRMAARLLMVNPEDACELLGLIKSPHLVELWRHLLSALYARQVIAEAAVRARHTCQQTPPTKDKDTP